MRWMAIACGAALAATGLAWALVTTGHWPLDDRRQPALALYAANGALGQWLVDHGQPLEPGGTGALGQAGGAAGDQARRGGPTAAQLPEGLTAAELAAARESLRSDPRFRGRAALFKSGVPGSGGPGRG